MSSPPALAPRLAKWSAAAAAAVLAVVTAALPSESAQPGERPGSLFDLLREQSGSAPAADPAYQLRAADSGCLSDPSGDTVRSSDGVAEDEARADIIEFCVDYGSTLSLSVLPRQASDPTADPNWTQGLSFLGAALFTDDDDVADFLVGYFFVDGLQVVVLDRDDNEVCTGTGEYDGARLRATGIPSTCFGAPASLALGVSLFYDSDFDDPAAPVHLDDVPDGQLAVIDRSGDLPEPGTRAAGRLAGEDRFATSVAISRQQFPGTASEVYLARADAFADALSGGVLTNGPILLVPQCGTLPPVVRAEIARLDPGRVTALGGPAAVCDQILGEAASA